MSEKHEKSRFVFMLGVQWSGNVYNQTRICSPESCANFLVELWSSTSLHAECVIRTESNWRSMRKVILRQYFRNFHPTKDMLNFRLTRKTSQSCECQLCETNKIAGRHGFRQKLTKRKRGLPGKSTRITLKSRYRGVYVSNVLGLSSLEESTSV